jgi:hypothetical protein
MARDSSREPLVGLWSAPPLWTAQATWPDEDDDDDVDEPLESLDEPPLDPPSPLGLFEPSLPLFEPSLPLFELLLPLFELSLSPFEPADLSSLVELLSPPVFFLAVLRLSVL